MATPGQIRRRTIISFSVFFFLMAAACLAWYFIQHQSTNNGIPTTFRSVLDANERITRGTIFSSNHAAKTYPVSKAAEAPRVNGGIGLDEPIDTATWRLKVVKANGDTLQLTLADIQALPKTDVVFNFKCIEGWNQITYWSGVRFTDFLQHYQLNRETGFGYVGLQTPDKQYYVGIDMASMRLDQTILCFAMNGKPLPQNQGYPLRLIIPVKYGIKHLKRIGTMFFSNTRPPDYWYERGYDYYSGL